VLLAVAGSRLVPAPAVWPPAPVVSVVEVPEVEPVLPAVPELWRRLLLAELLPYALGSVLLPLVPLWP